MDAFQAIILGVVQGLTEFLPISSTAHLRIVPAFFGWADPGAAFSAVIQLGTLAAVLVYFARDIARLTVAGAGSLFSEKIRASPDARMAWAIAAGNIPIVVLGLSFRDFIENDARSLWLIATMLIILGLALGAAEKWTPKSKSMTSLTFWQIQLLGVFQALALIPGASRSGSTILGGLVLGLNRADAARFSFLLGIPAIGGSGLFQLLALVKSGVDNSGWYTLSLALIFSALSGYATIALLLKFLQTHTTWSFVIYRVLLGGGILIGFYFL